MGIDEIFSESKTPLEKEIENLLLFFSSQENIEDEIFIFTFENRDFVFYINLILPKYFKNINFGLELKFFKNNTLSDFIKSLIGIGVDKNKIIFIYVNNFIGKEVTSFCLGEYF